MTSIEIVEIINASREDGSAELLHKNFMAKIEKVLGAEHSAKFLAQYKDKTGRSLKCYALPKRETHLMVMSESYKVQAAVYDRMTELEHQTKNGLIAAPTTAEMFAQAGNIMVDLERRLNTVTNSIDHIEERLQRLESNDKHQQPTQSKKHYLLPQEIGSKLHISAKQVNNLLGKAGIQDNYMGVWSPTEKGKKFAAYIQTRKTGHCKRLMWDIRVVEELR